MIRKLEKIAKIKYCRDLIKDGMLKRDALKKARTHNKTYDKYINDVLLLNENEIREIDKIIEKIKIESPKNRVTLPKDVDKYHITTYISEPFYSVIKQEAEERQYAISVILREHAYKNLIAEGKVKLTEII